MVEPARKLDWDTMTEPPPRWGRQDPDSSDSASGRVDTAGARRCAVPGCRQPPSARLPLCREHRICPRCGAQVHVAGRVTLDCCALAVALVPRLAFRIPWHLMIRKAQKAIGWPHRMRHVRVVMGHKTVAKRLPFPEEE
jgi:hypothetical protein